VKSFLRNNKGFLAFLLLFGVFRTAVADWNPIPSASMHPNLLEGDVVLAHMGEPARGDIVTFRSPKDGTLLIKRLIALPGDTVEMRNERLYINGKGADYDVIADSLDSVQGETLRALQLSETIEGGRGGRRHIQVLPDLMAPRTFGPVKVPDGEYLMLGDNRDNSADSRVIGLVPRKLLVGRAERVLVSADYQGNWMPRTERFGMSLYRAN
jgi:signal peptidase I